MPQGPLQCPILQLYTNDLPDDVIDNIAIYADDTTLYSKRDQTSNLCLELASELESDLRSTVDRDMNWLIGFNTRKVQAALLDRFNNSGAVDVKLDGSVLEKSSIKMLGLSFSCKLDWGLYFFSIVKTASKKIGTLILSVKFLSLLIFNLYPYKFTIRSCRQYCCHIWTGAPSWYLDMQDKLQKRVCRTVGTVLAASFELLVHCRNVASLSIFYIYYFGRCSSELTELVPPPYSYGRSTHSER